MRPQGGGCLLLPRKDLGDCGQREPELAQQQTRNDERTEAIGTLGGASVMLTGPLGTAFRYNTGRRHSRLGQRSPIAYETTFHTTSTTLT